MSFSIREAIKQALLANPEFAALVPSGMIWSQFAPSSTSPAGPWVVMTAISDQELGAHDGNGNLAKQRFQFNVGGTDKEIVDTVLAILNQQFNGVNYNYVDGTGTHEITFLHADSRDGWDETSRTYHPSVDLFIWYNY